MSRKRTALKIAGCLCGLLVIVFVVGILTIRSPWFYEKVRRFVVDTVENATGGRVEARAFRFDWTRMRAEIEGFAIHGTEPAGKPPLFRANSIAIGLKIVSILKRDIDIQYLDVSDPRIYLIVYPDGRTNLPEPKVRPSNPKNPVETILNLAVARFDLRNGLFEVEAQGVTPFDAKGENLNANFQYEGTHLGIPAGAGPAGAITLPRYLANISIQPLTVHWPEFSPSPLAVTLALSLERNRVGITSAKIASGGSHVELSGAVEDLTAPHGAFEYDAHVLVAEAAPIVHIKELQKGALDVAGKAVWAGASNIAITGTLHGRGVDYRDSLVHLGDYGIDGTLAANGQGIDLTGVHLSGGVSGVGACTSGPTGKLWPCPEARYPVDGQIAKATLRGKDIELHDVALNGIGGAFHGEAKLRNLVRYTVIGEISSFDAKRVVALYTPQSLPWSATASGPVQLDGALGQKLELKITANLAISPAAEGPAVHGQISGAYAARDGVLDLGRSTVWLPSSRVDFSGALPPVSGRDLHARLETRDLNDVLPVLGIDTAKIPVKLEGGTAIFDGTITGKLDDPQIAGHLNVTRFSYLGTILDSLDGDAAASPEHAQMQKATASRSSLRAQFQGSIGLTNWEADDSSTVAGSGTIRNANIADLAAVLGNAAPAPSDLPTGTANGSAQVAGTVGSPSVGGDIEVLKGAFHDEPFDRFAAHVKWAGRRAELSAGQLTASGKAVQLSATFDAAPDRLDAGRLHFEVSTNIMQLEQVHTLMKERPGVKGTVQVATGGDVDIIAPAPGQPRFRIASLNADISGKNLQLNGQPFGASHLTASSQGQVLNAHLESDFANSAIRGDGQWQLSGDYPGTATVRFSKLDFAQLRAWISPSQSAAAQRIGGSAEGELHIDGPVLKPENLKAELQIPKLEIGAAPGTVSGAGAIALTNSGPIVASMVNSVVTVTSARLVGRSTDLSITGRLLIDQKSPLDLRVNGRVDLAIVQTFDSDLVSSGTVTADASIRGPFDAPQLNGRMQFQNAAFSLADFPNGISNANGAVVFTAERATIQSFTGETGGGKIELSGSAGYSSGATVFQLQAHAQQVRVRYPEGVSTVLNANLNLTGTPDRSMLDGTVTVLRTGFNLQSDFSSLIAKSAEPVRTPAAQTGLLGGLNFDIQINTDPDIQLQSALTEDLQADANLRLRGTVSNPAVVGRVTITQGQVVFYGTKYTINQGTIAFYNALKVEPILDVDLETKAHGIDITLTVAGPLNKLHLTPRSDPPLQFSEIVALLATGRTPTSDPTMLAQQSTAPGSWQQMGASALLGQAIASPVAGRLQRFFGVSKLRIDPTLPGVENNPQARLTLEQQITPEITFTYITNVTNSNPQVIRMEWSFSKQWSVVALRDENGTFGVDFFFKRRF